LISTIAGTESRTWPKNSRHTVRIAFGIVCRMNRAEVMIPSQPSFCTPGRPARNLSVTSLPSPALRNAVPAMASVSRRFRVVPSMPGNTSLYGPRQVAWLWLPAAFTQTMPVPEPTATPTVLTFL
jgi:hypothetical protein